MTEAVSTSADADAAAQRAAEQARLRKERREAKIRAGGSARLNKITGIDGRIVGDSSSTSNPPSPPLGASPPVTKSPTPSHPQSVPSDEHGDPDEVDISEHHYVPQRSNNPAVFPTLPPQMSDDQLRQMMLGLDRPGGAGSNPEFPPDMAQDPIMKLMSQMMGGGGFPGMPGSNDPSSSSPSPFPSFAGMNPFQQQAQPALPDPYTSLWRLVHALVAIGLGIYVALLTSFTGTRLEREREANASDPLYDANDRHKRTFFWVFATAETLLLTTRLFLDGKRSHQPPGMLYTVLGFVPEPYKGYIEVGLRYVQMVTTVRADILACMFVLGVCAWWNQL